MLTSHTESLLLLPCQLNLQLQEGSILYTVFSLASFCLNTNNPLNPMLPEKETNSLICYASFLTGLFERGIGLKWIDKRYKISALEAVFYVAQIYRFKAGLQI